MRAEHTRYLVDPATGEPLKLIDEQTENNHVMTGVLASSRNRYPVVDGIPQLRPAHNDAAEFASHQERTADSFSFEWNNIYQENDYEKQNFLHFLHPFVKEADLKGKVLCDIGCGSGRFTKHAALAGAKVVIATDLGDSVKYAFELTKNLPNVCVVKADVYHPPVHRQADLTFSIGVLHHLPQPENGFKKLAPTVKPGGHVLIWVYNRRNNFRAVYVFETMRKVTRRIPPKTLYRLGHLPAAGVQACNYVTAGLKQLGANQLAKKVPFSYYANFPYSMKLNDAFDVFATPKSNYYYVEEIERWFQHANLDDIKTFEHPEAGITSIGTVKPISEDA